MPNPKHLSLKELLPNPIKSTHYLPHKIQSSSYSADVCVIIKNHDLTIKLLKRNTSKDYFLYNILSETLNNTSQTIISPWVVFQWTLKYQIPCNIRTHMFVLKTRWFLRRRKRIQIQFIT